MTLSIRTHRCQRGVVALSLVAFLAMLRTSTALAGDCPGDVDGSGVVDGADLASLLGAWGGRGPLDLDGDGTVGGADLAVLLGGWGDCPAPSCDGFALLAFDDTPVDLSDAGLPTTVMLSGMAATGPMGQDGVITAVLPNGEPVIIEFHPGFQKVMVGPAVIDFAPLAAPGIMFVNGAPMPLTAGIEMFEGDLASGAPVGAWSPVSKATLAVVALTSTPEWRCSVEAALEFEGGVAGGDGNDNDNGNQGGWCKFTAYGVATVIATLAGSGCFALTGACAAGSVVTLGGMAIPCTTLVGLCAGGTFAGTAAAYEAVLALWGD